MRRYVAHFAFPLAFAFAFLSRTPGPGVRLRRCSHPGHLFGHAIEARSKIINFAVFQSRAGFSAAGGREEAEIQREEQGRDGFIERILLIVCVLGGYIMMLTIKAMLVYRKIIPLGGIGKLTSDR